MALRLPRSLNRFQASKNALSSSLHNRGRQNGVQEGVSWGLMLAESTQEVLAGHFGNFIAASGMLFALLMGLNLLADALQDAMDPREVAV